MNKRWASNRLKVYVAGPMSVGDLSANIANGIKLGKQMVRDGLAPYVPHMDAYMFWTMPDDYEVLLDWDFAWVQVSDAVFRIPGPSPGADRETELARHLGIPVFTEYRALLLFAEMNGRLAGTPRIRYETDMDGQQRPVVGTVEHTNAAEAAPWNR